MPYYRRNHIGEYFFITLVTRNRMQLFHDESARRLLHIAIKETQLQRPWKMDAIVLMPEHIHMLWIMPQNDNDYSTRISILKRKFTNTYLGSGGREASVPEGQKKRRLHGVWQQKFWEHTIKDAKDYNMHLDYIHTNPVRHGYVEKPKDWPWSSFNRHVKDGHYESDWQGRTDLPENTGYLWME